MSGLPLYILQQCGCGHYERLPNVFMNEMEKLIFNVIQKRIPAEIGKMNRETNVTSCVAD